MGNAVKRDVRDRSAGNAHRSESYETLRQRHIQDMRARVPHALERLSWTAERLKVERNERLRQLVRFAKEHSVWHRTRLKNVDSDRITEDSIRDIPPMTKRDLMENFDAIATDPRVTLDICEAHLATLKSDAYLMDRYHVNASGGSSGRRGLAVFDWEAWTEFYLMFMRQLIHWRISSSGLRNRPIVGAAVAAQDPTHASGSLPVTFSDASTSVWHRFPVTLPLDEIVEGLNRVQPEAIVGYPSLVHQLAFAAQRGALQISPGLIVCSSEPLLPEIRAAVGEAWRAPILNNWASTEAGAMASSCGKGPGLHLSDDVLIVEAVDAQGRPVGLGNRSAKVLVTPLFNPSPLPVIRYEITDEITLLDEPCPCGSAHRLVADIEGRLDDMFEYPGRTSVHPHIFRSRLGKERYIVEYQVRQTARGADIDVHCNGPVELDRLRSALIDDLRRVGLPESEIAIALVGRIERPASGKLKRFVPLQS
ncbi:MAG: AMP-dependent synthetase [Proteobacteria bacterium]|nr:MAG: AMP-dependent synthetase [Pseudomonadota bacterium]